MLLTSSCDPIVSFLREGANRAATTLLLGHSAIGRNLVLVVGGRHLTQTLALRFGDRLVLLDMRRSTLEFSLGRT